MTIIVVQRDDQAFYVDIQYEKKLIYVTMGPKSTKLMYLRQEVLAEGYNWKKRQKTTLTLYWQYWP